MRSQAGPALPLMVARVAGTLGLRTDVCAGACRGEKRLPDAVGDRINLLVAHMTEQGQRHRPRSIRDCQREVNRRFRVDGEAMRGRIVNAGLDTLARERFPENGSVNRLVEHDA